MGRRDAPRRRDAADPAAVDGERAFLDFRERSMKICSEAQAILRTRESVVMR